VTSADSPPTLWDFSVRLYGRPGVADACLALQERLGIDVNLLLFFVWWSATGRGNLDNDAFATLVQRATRWNHDVVRPFRATRKLAKGGDPSLPAADAEAVYRKMLETELLLERAEQTILERTAEECFANAPDVSRTGSDSRRLIDRYLAEVGAVPESRDEQALATILSSSLG
jgi:uncharacterized protein (TIGR02444 family)